MDYFPSCLEWKLQALSLPHQISSVFLLCFCFYFLLSKSNKADLSGAPQQVCWCSAAWHYTLLCGRELRTLKSQLHILAFQPPDPAHGAKNLQCLHVAPRPLLRRWEVFWHPMEVEAPRAPVLCVTAWEVSKKGICQLYKQGTWNLGTSYHQLAWRANTPVPCMFYKHRVNLCGGHHQPEISPTAVKNFIWSLKSQITWNVKD